MAWSTWRMYRRRIVASVPVHAGAARDRNHDIRVWDDEYKPTRMTFKARSYEEAMRKGDKFWRESELGMGSFIMKQEEITNG